MGLNEEEAIFPLHHTEIINIHIPFTMFINCQKQPPLDPHYKYIWSKCFFLSTRNPVQNCA